MLKFKNMIQEVHPHEPLTISLGEGGGGCFNEVVDSLI